MREKTFLLLPSKSYYSGGATDLTTKVLTLPLSQKQIMQIIPHRSPSLFIDKILELEPGQKAIGVYRVKEGDCEGHFPDNPIMPGFKILEIMNQIGAVALLSIPENRDKIAAIVGTDRSRFRKRVGPGDEIRAEVEKTQEGRIGRCTGKAYVNKVLVAEAEILFTILPKEI